MTSDDEAGRVVLTVNDTLRANRLGGYGHDRAPSPAIGAWAGDATVFTQACAIAPWTLPSVKTAQSGLPPGQ